MKTRKQPSSLNDLSVLSTTLFAEACGEPEIGIRAVATVIYNRAKGNSEKFSDVCLRPKQFSCWNSGMPKPGTGKPWDFCLQVAEEMLSGSFISTGSWDHYYNPNKCDPVWAHIDGDKSKSLLPHDDIGNHRFLAVGKWPGKSST